jgi:hypothetical protein
MEDTRNDHNDKVRQGQERVEDEKCYYKLSLTWLKRSITGQQQNPTAVRVDKMCVWKGQRSVLQGDNIFKDMSQ